MYICHYIIYAFFQSFVKRLIRTQGISNVIVGLQILHSAYQYCNPGMRFLSKYFHIPLSVSTKYEN